MQNVYKIANVKVKIEYFQKFTDYIFKPYLIDGNDYDIFIQVTNEDLEYEKSLCPNAFEEGYENIAILRKFSEYMLTEKNGLLFHASSVAYKGNAYLFTAPSGTGKSTHTAILKKLLGDELTYINDDKPILRLENGIINVYGNPWSGKHFRGENVKFPLKAIIKVKRATENSVQKISSDEMLPVLFEQSAYATDEVSGNNLLDLILKISKSADFYILNCNKEDNAGETTIKYILKGDKENEN